MATLSTLNPGGELPPADPLVLIIDDNVDDREACIRMLNRISGPGYRFAEAYDEASALAAMAAATPDVVLLDYSLPGRSDGLEIMRRLRDRYPFLPVIMLTGQGNEAVAAAVLKAGANDYFRKAGLTDPAVIGLTEMPGDGTSLRDAISHAMLDQLSRKSAAQSATGIKVLIIDDNADDREACIRGLRRVPEIQYSFVEAEDGASGLRAITEHRPDVVLLDYLLPASDGVEVLLQIRREYAFLPVILMTGHGNEALAVRGIKAGATDYIPKSTLPADVLHASIMAGIEHDRDARTIDWQSVTIQGQRQRLEDSNHFLHSLLDHIPDPIFVKDGAHRWLMANWAFRELIGAAGQSLADYGQSILPPDAVADFWSSDTRALQSGERSVSEQSIADQNGARRLFSIKRAIFTDRLGDRVLVGVMRDITAQRQAEDDFKLQAAQLVTQTQDLASLGAILEESLQEIFIIDAATFSILKINRGARRNLGYAQPEMEGRSVLELLPHFSGQQLRNLLEPLSTGEQIECIYHTEYRRKDGGLYEVEVHTQSGLSHGRRVFVQIALDETERKRIERMKSEFISSVSHELRTPLTSIRGALGLVNAGAVGGLPEKAMAMVRIAHSNAERLSRLVNDLLALEKSVSGSLSLEVREVQVADLLRQAIESHAGYAEKHKVRFVLDGAAQGTVMADAGRLMQVLANLMSNAAKFSPPGAVVTLRAQEQVENVRFEVQDRGCGIPLTFRPLVFERFAQADSSLTRRFDGTGLGLAISKQLVEAMRGRIGFTSEVGLGSTFFFELPKPAKASPPAGKRDDSVRVLICEDDPDMALIVKMAIEQAGFETAIASTIPEIRRQLQETPFAVMLLDLGLGDDDGLEFLEKLRADKPTGGIPVVVVSARAEEARKIFQGDPASVDWLVKPLNQDLLVKLVRKAVRQGESMPRLLYLGRDTGIARELTHSLANVARLVIAKDPADCRRELGSRHFDLLIAEPELAAGSGKELLDHVTSAAEGMPPLLILPEFGPEFDGDPKRTLAAQVTEKVAKIVNQKVMN
jgi:PAS domain S-box-containing protein